MKILFITGHFALPEQPGAPRPWKIAEYLTEIGHEVTVVTRKRHYLDENIRVVETKKFTPKIINGIKIIGCDTSRGRRKSIPKRIINYFSFSYVAFKARCNIEKPDVIIVGTPPFIIPLTGLILKHLYNAFAVLEIRDLYPQYARDMGKLKNKLLYYIWEKWEDFFRRRYDHIVPVLPKIANHLIQAGISPKKVTVITNAFDKEHLQDIIFTGEIKHFFQENSNKCIIVYGGGMGYSNNLWTVIQAAELCKKNKKIVFAFFGEGEEKECYQRYVNQRKLKNCYFFPAQSRIIINEVFRKAFALVLSFINKKSFEFIIPNKIFEYQGAARPIVFAGKGDTADLIKAAGSGFVVEPENPYKLAEALVYLVENQHIADVMGKRGYDYIIEHFRREIVFQKWNDVLKKSLQH